mmetsp:Transcript_37595/g.108090  ORF Transcript_37595/g.108090 Transcript_37595/m.108090 type:complete len:205 (-) Transcript_37595:218-832(-)
MEHTTSLTEGADRTEGKELILRRGFKSNASSTTSVGDEEESVVTSSAGSFGAESSPTETSWRVAQQAEKASQDRLTLATLLQASAVDFAEMYRGGKAKATSGAVTSEDESPADEFDSTRVHMNGEEVWVEWSDDEKTSNPMANDVNFLSTAVHLDGQAIWDAWPQTDDGRPVYIDSSHTSVERRLRFKADTDSYRAAAAPRRRV